MARRIGGGTGSPAAGLRVEPEPTPGWEAAAGDRRVTFPEWVVETLRGLFDLQFRRPVTRTLLPLAYLLGLLFAFAVPVAAVVLAWRFSALTGVLAVLVAVPLGLSIAAAVRLFLEFLVNAARLADKVEHMSDLADDISQVLTEVAEPMSQLSEDVRAVQFWRWRGSRK